LVDWFFIYQEYLHIIICCIKILRKYVVPGIKFELLYLIKNKRCTLKVWMVKQIVSRKSVYFGAAVATQPTGGRSHVWNPVCKERLNPKSWMSRFGCGGLASLRLRRKLGEVLSVSTSRRSHDLPETRENGVIEFLRFRCTGEGTAG